MALVFNPQLENSPLNDIRDAIDSGGAGSLDIFDGQTLLSSLPLSLPSFSSESGGQSIANSITAAVAVTSGDADRFEFRTAYDANVFSGDIPGDLDLGETSIVEGQIINIYSFVLTEGVTQAREYASTVQYPYNTPPLVFDSPPSPSDLVEPKDLKLDLVRAQDYESDGLTLRTATYNGADILLDGVPIVSVADVKALDLTFDDSDNALVVYTDSSDNLFVYDDSNQSTITIASTGQDPRIYNDRQASPSIIISYRRGNDVFYRVVGPSGPSVIPNYWFDAADESTFTLSGNEVLEFRSKGFVPSVTLTPLNANIPTKLGDSVNFDNSTTGGNTTPSQALTYDGIPSETDWVILVVLQGASNKSDPQNVVSRSSGGAFSVFYDTTRFIGSTGEVQTYSRSNTVAEQASVNTGFTSGQRFLVTSLYTNDDFGVRVNGGALEDTVSRGIDNLLLADLILGANRSGSSIFPAESFAGQINEVMLYTGSLTPSQIQDAEDYLTAKWGL